MSDETGSISLKLSSRSITRHVYAQLRDELVSCQIYPGAQLRTNALSERYGVSLSSIREALSNLAGEGLVVADPQKGFRAAPLSTQDLHNLSETEIELDAICIRKALALGGADWEQALRRALAEVLAAPAADPANGSRIALAFETAHLRFHAVLVSPYVNNWMTTLRERLSVQAGRYRQICTLLGASPKALHDGYTEIEAAAIARDVETTIRHVTIQRQRNTSRFMRVLENSGDGAFL